MVWKRKTMVEKEEINHALGKKKPENASMSQNSKTITGTLSRELSP
jgi:hypothetical protein